MNKLELMKIANEVRKGAVTAVYNAKSGHPGGSLSAADIYAYLFFEEMNIDPKEPKKADRDRFVLSKGHTAPGYYATDITLATRSNPETNQRVLDHIPANRWGDTQDLMGAAVFLASQASNYVNGHLLVVDGGYLVR